MSLTEQLEQYASLVKRKRQLQAEVDQLTKQYGAMEEALIDAMTDAGMDSVKLSSGARVTVRPTVYPHLPDGREAAAKALKAAGYGNMVVENFNSNSLGALVRELHASDEGLPKEFAGAIEANEVHKISVTG